MIQAKASGCRFVVLCGYGFVPKHTGVWWSHFGLPDTAVIKHIDHHNLTRSLESVAHALDLEKALADFTVAITHAPESAMYFALRGSIYQRLNQFDKAIDELKGYTVLGRLLCGVIPANKLSPTPTGIT